MLQSVPWAYFTWIISAISVLGLSLLGGIWWEIRRINDKIIELATTQKIQAIRLDEYQKRSTNIIK